MTRSRAKALHDKMNSFLYMCDLDPTMDGTLPHANALCILRYEPLHRLHGSPELGHEEKEKQVHFGAATGAAGAHADPIGEPTGARRNEASPPNHMSEKRFGAPPNGSARAERTGV